jgi:hypothetical protein
LHCRIVTASGPNCTWEEEGGMLVPRSTNPEEPSRRSLPFKEGKLTTPSSWVKENETLPARYHSRVSAQTAQAVTKMSKTSVFPSKSCCGMEETLASF